MSNLSMTPSLLEKYTNLTQDCIDYHKELDKGSIVNDNNKAATYNAFKENMQDRNGIMELMTELAQILKDYKKIKKALEKIDTQKTQSEGQIQVTGKYGVGIVKGDQYNLVTKESDKLKCDKESLLKKKIEEVQITNEKLKNDLERDNNALSKLKSDIESLKNTSDKEINQLSQENSLLKLDSDKNITKISDECREKDCLQKQNIEIIKIINEQNITITELKKEIDQSKKKIKKLEEELETRKEPTIGHLDTLESNI